MLRGSNGVKCQEWTERLERFAKSRQTVAEFCRDERVSAPSFYQWKQKLGRVSAVSVHQNRCEIDVDWLGFNGLGGSCPNRYAVRWN